jgi:hypothetical protein
MSNGCSNMLKLISCGTRPIRRMASERCACRSTPHTRTSPALGLTSELTTPISVDLPAPLGPSRAKKSPSATRSDTPLRASTPLS